MDGSEDAPGVEALHRGEGDTGRAATASTGGVGELGPEAFARDLLDPARALGDELGSVGVGFEVEEGGRPRATPEAGGVVGE